MPILCLIEKLNNFIYPLFMQINYNNECLVYVHSLDFPKITNFEKFLISSIWLATGPILPFVVLALHPVISGWKNEIFMTKTKHKSEIYAYVFIVSVLALIPPLHIDQLL